MWTARTLLKDSRNLLSIIVYLFLAWTYRTMLVNVNADYITIIYLIGELMDKG